MLRTAAPDAAEVQPRPSGGDESIGRDPSAGSRIAGLAFLVALVFYGSLLYRLAGRPLETDELKYIVLARELTADPDSYTLRGTILLPRLGQDVNDVPLFYHPPLVPLALRGWYEVAIRREEDTSLRQLHPGGSTPDAGERRLESQRLLRAASPRFSAVPVAAHVATLALLWWYWGRRRPLAERLWPVLLLALSPVAAEFGTQVWLDTPVTLMVLLTVTLYHRAVERGRSRDFAWAGISLGLALLTKFTAVLLAPILAIYHLAKLGWGRSSLRAAGIALLPAAALAAPWFATFYGVYGELLPSWIAPTEESVSRFPYVAMMLNRSPLYYLQALAIFMPASLFALGALRPRLRDRDTGLLAGLAIALLVAFTAIGVTGGGFQTRYVLPAVPALCLLAGRVIARLPRWSWGVAGLLLVWSTWTLEANLADERFEHSAEVELFVPWRDGGGPIR